MLLYLCPFLAALLLTLVWTPAVIRAGIRFKVLDYPGLRKIHTAPRPRLGGVAIALPILAVVAVIFFLDSDLGRAFRAKQTEILVLLSSATFIFLVGLADDLRGVRAKTKLYAQILAALTLCLFEIRIETVHLPGLKESFELGAWSWPVTIFWVVGMTNAVNLIDGLDGLAAGISAITTTVVVIVALSMGQMVMGVLMLVCLGSLLAFLHFNFNPARIFLGDSGTYLLGYLLGAGSVVTSTKSGALIGLALPLVAMGVPIFDTLFAILRRSLERRPLFAPDGGHIHHRLLALGITQRKAVILLYLVTLLVTAFGMFGMMARGPSFLLLLVCLAGLLAGFFRLCGAVRLRDTLQRIKRRMEIGREIQRERNILQESDLALREAETFEDWWKSLCEAADRLDFADLSVQVSNGRERPQRLTWSHGKNGVNGQRCTEFIIPTQERRSGHPVRINGRIAIKTSVESVGRKVALFSRLVECDTSSGATCESPHNGRMAGSPETPPEEDGWWES